MKNRWTLLLLLLLALIAYFLWAMFSGGEKAPEPAATPPMESPEELIDQGQPVLPVSSDVLLIEKDGLVLLGAQNQRVDWENKSLSTTDESFAHDYVRGDLRYGLSGRSLVQIRGGEEVTLAENVLDVQYMEDYILYLNREGVSLLSTGKNTVQRLLESSEERQISSLESFFLAKGTDYYGYANTEQRDIEIYLNETKELLAIVDGVLLSASPTEPILAFSDAENMSTIGVYMIETGVNTRVHLTGEGEQVHTRPFFDEQGHLRYLSTRDGILHINIIELETKERQRTALSETDKFKEELWVDGYYVVSFEDRFYYGQDTQSLSYYNLGMDKIRFHEGDIFLTSAEALRVIRGGQMKEYSLMGIPEKILPGKGVFYYTFSEGLQSYLSRVEISF